MPIPGNFMNRNLYAFTIKDTYTKQAYLTEATYSKVLNILRDKGDILDLVFESKGKHGKPARLHCHGIIEFTKIPRLTTVAPSTFSCKFERIYSLDGWTKYMSKYNKPTPVESFDDISEQDLTDLREYVRENLV